MKTIIRWFILLLSITVLAFTACNTDEPTLHSATTTGIYTQEDIQIIGNNTWIYYGNDIISPRAFSGRDSVIMQNQSRVAYYLIYLENGNLYQCELERLGDTWKEAQPLVYVKDSYIVFSNKKYYLPN